MTIRLAERTVRSADGTTICYHTTGFGEGLVLVGGALAGGLDYMELADLLAQRFEVHLLDRRGRGASGPQGPGYSIDTECDDLRAVAEATDSLAVFGHSFGGLIALETARRGHSFEQIIVYEPGVPFPGGIRLGWLDRYQQFLERGDRRGAFATMVKGAGFAPGPLAVMPLWYVRGILRVAIRKERWASIEPLLEANLAEHRQLETLLATAQPSRYSSITGHVVLLAGSKSPPFASSDLISQLAGAIPDADVEIIEGLDHLAPEQRPIDIAAAISRNVHIP